MHNASCLSVHVWAQERGKEVNCAFRRIFEQSTAKHLFSDFQTENTTPEFDIAKNHCHRDLQTEGWTHQQKTSLTKLGNKKLNSSATPSCIISHFLVSSCIILDFETANTICEFDTWDGHHCRTYQPKIGLKKNGTVIRREDTCYSILILQFPTQIAKKGSVPWCCKLHASHRSRRKHAWFQNKKFEFRTILCHWATLAQTTASLCGLNLGVARTIESSCIAVVNDTINWNVYTCPSIITLPSTKRTELHTS